MTDTSRDYHPRPPSRLRRAFIWTILAIGVIFMGTVSYLLMTGPHMIYHQNLRPHQAIMPPLPRDTTPVSALEFPAPTTQQARTLKNPLQPTPENLARGKVYYDYYCVFCHDTNGSGNAEVGRSYTPAPSDLRHPRLQSLTDGQLLQRSLTGTGHSPVLEQVIPPDYRWYVVLHVRQLNPESRIQNPE